MKTVKSNLPKHSDKNRKNWDDEDYIDHRNYRLNGKKLDRKRPIQNWTKAWSEHMEEADEHDEFYENR